MSTDHDEAELTSIRLGAHFGAQSRITTVICGSTGGGQYQYKEHRRSRGSIEGGHCARHSDQFAVSIEYLVGGDFLTNTLVGTVH